MKIYKGIVIFLLLLFLMMPLSQKAYGVVENSVNKDSKVMVDGKTKILLKEGSRGRIVTELQKKLCIMGYKIALTGIYDDSTVKAVADLQILAGINPTGFPDVDTNSIFSEIGLLDLGPSGLKAANADVKDSLSKENFINRNKYASYTEYFIWVNKASFSVNILKGEQGEWKIIKEFPCTIGIGGVYETPCGIFQIGTRGKWFLSKYNVSAKYYTHITDHILFHSILFDPKGKRIVDSRLKKRLSHGCIRLAIPDAIYIYDNIIQGTTVLIN